MPLSVKRDHVRVDTITSNQLNSLRVKVELINWYLIQDTLECNTYSPEHIQHYIYFYFFKSFFVSFLFFHD